VSADLTVVFYTANFIREPFGAYVRGELLKSIGDLPLISVSQKPMDFGRNVCVGDIGRSYINIYRQMLIGAKAAETKWVAFTEDDILYPPCHFEYRPTSEDVAAYDMNKWAFYSWVKPPVFFQSSYRLTTGCIASRRLVIDALEERFAKYPDGKGARLGAWGEIGRYEKLLGVTVRPQEAFHSDVSHVVCFHEDALGFGYLGTRKGRPNVRVTELPYWGKAEDILGIYGRGVSP
jgi:hypothetical protein